MGAEVRAEWTQCPLEVCWVILTYKVEFDEILSDTYLWVILGNFIGPVHIEYCL